MVTSIHHWPSTVPMSISYAVVLDQRRMFVLSLISFPSTHSLPSTSEAIEQRITSSSIYRTIRRFTPHHGHTTGHTSVSIVPHPAKNPPPSLTRPSRGSHRRSRIDVPHRRILPSKRHVAETAVPPSAEIPPRRFRAAKIGVNPGTLTFKL